MTHPFYFLDFILIYLFLKIGVLGACSFRDFLKKYGNLYLLKFLNCKFKLHISVRKKNCSFLFLHFICKIEICLGKFIKTILVVVFFKSLFLKICIRNQKQVCVMLTTY